MFLAPVRAGPAGLLSPGSPSRRGALSLSLLCPQTGTREQALPLDQVWAQPRRGKKSVCSHRGRNPVPCGWAVWSALGPGRSRGRGCLRVRNPCRRPSRGRRSFQGQRQRETGRPTPSGRNNVSLVPANPPEVLGRKLKRHLSKYIQKVTLEGEPERLARPLQEKHFLKEDVNK